MLDKPFFRKIRDDLIELTQRLEHARSEGYQIDFAIVNCKLESFQVIEKKPVDLNDA